MNYVSCITYVALFAMPYSYRNDVILPTSTIIVVFLSCIYAPARRRAALHESGGAPNSRTTILKGVHMNV